VLPANGAQHYLMAGEFQIFPESAGLDLLLTLRMRDLIVLLLHLTTVILRIAFPRGIRSVIAESVLMKQQLLILNRTCGWRIPKI
jgi:hypothetical protein